MTEAKWRLYEAVIADMEEAHDERCQVTLTLPRKSGQVDYLA